MPPPPPPRNSDLTSAALKANWLARTKRRFFELNTLKWPPVSHTFCFAGLDPETFHNVIYGSNSGLENTLLNIYAEHGPVDLHVRGRDVDGRHYFKCAQPGNKYGPVKAVICISAPKVDKGRMAAAEAEVLRAEVEAHGSGSVVDQEEWEVVWSHEVLVEDDWVKV